MHNLRRGMRNIWRSKVRTIMVVLMAGTALALAITMLAIQSGIELQVENLTGNLGTNISIRPAGTVGAFGRGEPLEEALLDGAENTPHVTAVHKSLTLMLPTGVGQARQQQRSIFLGTSQTGQINVQGVTVEVTEGRPLAPEDADKAVVIMGRDILEQREATLGGTVDLGGTSFEVIGVIDSGNRFADSAIVMPLLMAQELADREGLIMEATVVVDDLANVDAVVQALQEQLGEAADVVSQKDQAMQRAEQALGMVRSGVRAGLVITLAAAGLIIFFTMLLTVRERTREIGVLKVLGASAGDLISSFAMEAATLAVIACLVGSLFFAFGGDALASRVMNTAVQTQAPAGGMPGGIGGQGGRFAERFAMQGGRFQSQTGGLDVELRLEDLYKIAGAAVGLGLLGSLLPALYAVRLKPAEVLRNE